MFHNQDYEQNCKFLFIIHLHDDRNERIKNVTFFFRMRKLYLSFHDSINDKITTCLQQRYISMKDHQLTFILSFFILSQEMNAISSNQNRYDHFSKLHDINIISFSHDIAHEKQMLSQKKKC